MRKIMCSVRVVAYCVALCAPASAGTIYVDVDATTGQNNGLSWADAYTSLSTAIENASIGDEIWVAEGTYDGTIVLKNGVKIYGGFEGTETSASASDPDTYQTYISGGGMSRAVDSTDNDSSTVLRGLYVTEGSVTSFFGLGAGMLLTNSNAIFVRCVFTANSATAYGGAVAILGGSPTFVNCQFYDNDAGFSCGAVLGRDGASPTFVNCLFYKNLAWEGGAFCNLSGVPTFINCTFSNNEASNDTQTVGKGGALFDNTGKAVLRNCILWNNIAVTSGTEEIYNNPARGGRTTVTYSDVKGVLWPGAGNITVDPDFRDPALDDYRLEVNLFSQSPCKDAGNDSDVPADAGDLDWDGDQAEPVPYDLSAEIDRIVSSHVDMGSSEAFCPAVTPPTTPSGEAGFAKNRYISLVPGSPGTQTAIRVTLTATDIDIVEFEDAIGRQWWIGPPTEYCENSGQESPPCSSPPVSFMGVRLHKCAPYVADWDALLGSGVALHVFGSRVVPASTYEIQAIHVDCDPGDESNFSTPLVVTTSIWGDVAGRFVGGQWQAPDGSVDISKDVTAMLDKFRNLDGAPIKARCDIEPELVDQLVNISDVDYVSDAYRGFPYPFSEPQVCREGGGGEPPPSGD